MHCGILHLAQIETPLSILKHRGANLGFYNIFMPKSTIRKGPNSASVALWLALWLLDAQSKQAVP